jgi:lipopolysaccharide export system permease protein
MHFPILKRLHLLILKSFFGPFLLTFFIVIFVLVMQFLFKYINDLIGKGLEFKIVAEFMLYLSTSMVPLALPLALLMAALMTFGNLGEFNELTALKSSGVSLQRIMAPLLIITILLSIGAFFFSNYVLPVANLKMRSLLYDIQRQRPEFQIIEGVFYNGIEGYSIRIGDKNHKTGMLYDLRIYDHTQKHGNNNITYSDSGTMKLTEDERYLVITLYNGQSYDELAPEEQNRRNFTYPLRRDKFQEQIMTIEMKGFELNRTDESLFRGNYNMMSLAQLRHVEDSILTDVDEISKGLINTLNKSTYRNFQRATSNKPNPNPGDTLEPSILVLNGDSLFSTMKNSHKLRITNQAITQARSSLNYVTTSSVNSDSKIRRLRRYQIEIQRKFTLSFACFIFFFIGAPLGAIIRKGGLGMPTVISVLFFLAYYVISLSGEKFVRESMVSPFQGMWISAVVLLPIGIFLTYKAATDAAIMNMETYSNFFRKITRFFKYYRLKFRLS